MIFPSPNMKDSVRSLARNFSLKLHSRLEDILGTHTRWRKNVAPKPMTLFPLSSRVSVLLPRVEWAVAASSHRRWAGEPQDMGSPHQMLLEHQLWGRSLLEWSLPEPGPSRERPQPRGAAKSRCPHPGDSSLQGPGRHGKTIPHSKGWETVTSALHDQRLSHRFPFEQPNTGSLPI